MDIIVAVLLGIAAILSLIELINARGTSLLAWACTVGFGVLFLARVLPG